MYRYWYYCCHQCNSSSSGNCSCDDHNSVWIEITSQDEVSYFNFCGLNIALYIAAIKYTLLVVSWNGTINNYMYVASSSYNSNSGYT